MEKQGVQAAHAFYKDLVRALVSFIEEKNEYLRGHAGRVAAISVRFAREISFPKRELDRIYLAGLLHDIGMVYVPDAVVLKEGALTEDEIGSIREHPLISEKLLASQAIFRGLLPLVRYHHEAYGGGGYPDGRKGDAIPLGARVLKIADCYDAMTSPRPYREAMSRQDALDEIANSANTQFDGILAAGFLKLMSPAASFPSPPSGVPGVSDAVRSILEKFNRGKIELQVLSNVVHEVQKVLKNPISTTDDLAGVIEKDAVISLKLISVANSSLYRGTKKIMTVSQAVPRLGLKQTQSIISAIANKSLYTTDHEDFQSLMQDMWMHSLACAYSSRLIARQLGLGDMEKYFLLGLIHDVGKVLLLKALPDIISGDGGGIPVEDVVKAMQEVHAGFGGALLKRWGFSQDFVTVAEMHEKTSFAASTGKEVLVVSVANNLTRTIGYSLFSDQATPAEDLESARLLGIDGSRLDAVAADVQKVMQAASHVF